tara:strand:+ start:60 stop:617 length:558 start_codon:yes stop_codon:yes gene_type:complete
MAVIEYKEGEHPQGLIGFRVARTLGSDNHRKEYFFSLSVHGAKAEALAKAKDQELAEIAQQNRRTNSLKRKSPYQFATGFCAKILVERKVRGGEMRTYFCPAFCVSHGGKDKAFRIPKLGFSGAWSKAVNYFALTRELNGNEALSLLARKPEKSVFTSTLLKKTQSRGHKLTSRRIKEMLDAEFE